MLLFIGATCLGACSEPMAPAADPTGDLGRVVVGQGRDFRLSPGTIVDHFEGVVEARAATPLPTLTLTTGPAAAGPVDLTLTNVHPGAVIRRQHTDILSSAQMLGCPSQTDQPTASCPTDDPDTNCEPPQIDRSEGPATRIQLRLDQPRCRRVRYALELPPSAADGPLKLAVIGRSATLADLEDALDTVARDQPDMVVLLGDNAQNSSLNGLRQLDFTVRQSGLAAVLVTGEGEIVQGSRSQFVQTFGPQQLSWTLKGVRMLAVDSARATLGARGVTRLDDRLDGFDDADRPLLVFTHTPPIDPVGPRDAGFESQLEAARMLSVITDHGVDALFSGHIKDSASSAINSTQFRLTSLAGAHQYLWVEVHGDAVDIQQRDL